MNFEIKKPWDSVVQVDIDSTQAKILWLNDLHLDSVHSDKTRLRKIIDENSDAFLIIGGDLYDVMQNTGDKRASKGSLKDLHKRDDYINSIVEEIVEFFTPYSNRILGFNYGNHETTQLKFHGIDITQWTVATLNAKNRTNIQLNDFAGYYSFYLKSRYERTISYLIYFSHRPISGGMRSKGMLSADIIAGRNTAANMYISEHIHTTFAHPFVVEEFNHSAKSIVYKEKWYVQMPTTKMEHVGRKIGYHHERNYGNTWNGAILISLDEKYDNVNSKSRVSHLSASPSWIRL